MTEEASREAQKIGQQIFRSFLIAKFLRRIESLLFLKR